MSVAIDFTKSNPSQMRLSSHSMPLVPSIVGVPTNLVTLLHKRMLSPTASVLLDTGSMRMVPLIVRVPMFCRAVQPFALAVAHLLVPTIYTADWLSVTFFPPKKSQAKNAPT